MSIKYQGKTIAGAGLSKFASDLDEMNASCIDASITPKNMHRVCNYRLPQTSYSIGDSVACPYHHDLILRCLTAGTTSSEVLNTSGQLDIGSSIEDGTVTWQVDEFGSAGGGLEIGDIGIAALGIDETKGLRRYLNGQVLIQDQFLQFTTKLKASIALHPSLACSEEEWQATHTMTVQGQVGKFVVDDEAGTIRLPKIIMPIQGLTDLSKLAEIVSAGLPGHTHSFSATAVSAGAHTHTRGTMNITGVLYSVRGSDGVSSSEGALYNTAGANNGANSSANAACKDIRFDASRNWTGATSSNGAHTHSVSGTTGSAADDVYGKSNTVQQEQIQYPYFIQVATGAETEDNIINEIELNNPYSLLDVKWSDKLLNNVSWLRSQGQANSKAIYNDVYELILKEYNSGTDETETVGGVSITFRRGSETNIKVTTNKSAYDSILSATGTAWYYVIDTANETFYLPQSDGFLQFGGDGDFVEAGLPNIKGSVNNITANSTQSSGANSSGAIRWISPTGQSSYGSNVTTYGYDLSLDASKSNQIYGKSNTVQPNAVKGYLYFYVGETVQNANLVNVGRIEEKIVDIQTELPHKLNDTQITNCITEILQRIKYTLENGTLTIKAGSVVIVPYGTTDRTSEFPVGATFINENFKVYDTCYADGKFFVWAEIVEDISQTTSVSDTQDRPFFISLTGNFISALMYSGSGTSDYTGTGNYYLYRTDENIMKRYMSGTFDDGVCSLPLGICTSNGSTTYSSIKQVFNGFGYIGSIKWIDTGVIGLASNGKNPDGSLNNIQWERNSILLKDVGNSGSAEYIDIYTTDGSWYNTLSYTVSETEPTTKTQAYWWYNPSINEHFRSDGTEWIKINATIIGSSSKVDGKIILFNPKQPFRAVDYNDKPEISGWGMPSKKRVDLTLGASGTSYKAPANGYFVLRKLAGGAGQAIRMFGHGTFASSVISYATGNNLEAFVPISKGDSCSIYYSATGATETFMFVYAEGDQ